MNVAAVGHVACCYGNGCALIGTYIEHERFAVYVTRLSDSDWTRRVLHSLLEKRCNSKSQLSGLRGMQVLCTCQRYV